MENAVHSVQNRRFLIRKEYRIISKIPSKIGIIYYPVAIFHTRDIITANAAETMWAVLYDSKYLGFTPTELRETTDRNGRNWKFTGLISTQAGNIKNDTRIIQKVNSPLFSIK